MKIFIFENNEPEYQILYFNNFILKLITYANILQHNIETRKISNSIIHTNTDHNESRKYY